MMASEISSQDMDFIKSRTCELLERCTVEAEDGIRVFTPDCSGRYPAIWTRDFSYMIEYATDLIEPTVIRDNLEYIIKHAHKDEGWI